MICNRNFPASLRIGAFIMEKFRVGIIGATGMVGQRFVLLTANHPWFTPVVLAASAHSAGKTYAQASEGKWHMADSPEQSPNRRGFDQFYGFWSETHENYRSTDKPGVEL